MDASTSKEFIRVYGQIQKLLDDVTVFAKEYYDASVVSYDEIANVPENLSDFNNDLGFVTEEEVDDKIQNSSIDDSNFLKKSGEEEQQACSIPTEFGELYAETPDDEDSSTRVATTEFVHNATNTDSIAQSVVGIISGNYTTSQEVEQAINQKIGQHSYNNVVSLVAGEIQSAVDEINNTIENIETGEADIPTNVSAFTNDAGYITLSDIPADSVTSVNGQTGNVQLTIPAVPTNVSAFTNDAGYITDAGVTSVNNRTGAVSVQENVQADWTATSGLASILHKPALKRVATTGDYNDLDNTPTIPVVPTNVSDFTNDAGYLTSFTESDPTVPAHVKAITQQDIADWNNKLSSFTETDPTVPAWAKASTKPTYTAAEVGAATLQQVQQEVASLVDQAPTTLDTLNELAAALGNDPDFATTVASQIGAKYTKPSGGIPDTDLSSSVQTSLGKADTALQSHQDISGKANKSEMSIVDGTGSNADKTTITLKTGTSATVLTMHQDVSGKANMADLATVATSGSYADLSNKPTIPTVPTTLSSFTDDLGSSPTHTHSQYLTSHQDVSGKENKLAIDSTAKTASFTAEVGKYYSVNVPNNGNVTVTLPTVSSSETYVQTIVFNVSIGSGTAAITFTPVAYKSDGFDTFETVTVYEVHAMWNGSGWVMVKGKLISGS